MDVFLEEVIRYLDVACMTYLVRGEQVSDLGCFILNVLGFYEDEVEASAGFGPAKASTPASRNHFFDLRSVILLCNPDKGTTSERTFRKATGPHLIGMGRVGWGRVGG